MQLTCHLEKYIFKMDNNVNTIKTFKIVLANNYLKMSVKSDWATNRTSTPRKVTTYMEAETETCHLVTLKLQISIEDNKILWVKGKKT